ncbi:hypothetical protein AB0E62_39630 [Streptomyces sp. NPDC038707]|uniref:hypothetical protein n=1 Tax=Streptomyces sp. NPDC038707 TaxID=3154329 RepID=UPI0033C791C0
MDTPPVPIDTLDQHITDLRAALHRAISLLGFAAGREAATDPCGPVCCWRPPTT